MSGDLIESEGTLQAHNGAANLVTAVAPLCTHIEAVMDELILKEAKEDEVGSAEPSSSEAVEKQSPIKFALKSLKRWVGALKFNKFNEKRANKIFSLQKNEATVSSARRGSYRDAELTLPRIPSLQKQVVIEKKTPRVTNLVLSSPALQSPHKVTPRNLDASLRRPKLFGKFQFPTSKGSEKSGLISLSESNNESLSRQSSLPFTDGLPIISQATTPTAVTEVPKSPERPKVEISYSRSSPNKSSRVIQTHRPMTVIPDTALPPLASVEEATNRKIDQTGRSKTANPRRRMSTKATAKKAFSNANRRRSSKTPVLYLEPSKRYDEKTGLFSNYETEAARESRIDTYRALHALREAQAEALCPPSERERLLEQEKARQLLLNKRCKEVRLIKRQRAEKMEFIVAKNKIAAIISQRDNDYLREKNEFIAEAMKHGIEPKLSPRERESSAPPSPRIVVGSSRDIIGPPVSLPPSPRLSKPSARRGSKQEDATKPPIPHSVDVIFENPNSEDKPQSTREDSEYADDFEAMTSAVSSEKISLDEFVGKSLLDYNSIQPLPLDPALLRGLGGVDKETKRNILGTRFDQDSGTVSETISRQDSNADAFPINPWRTDDSCASLVSAPIDAKNVQRGVRPMVGRTYKSAAPE